MRMLTILAFAVAAFHAGPLSAAELMPYEAEYDVWLKGYGGLGPVEAFEGQRRVRLSRDCRKWKLEHELTHTYNRAGHREDMQIVFVHHEALDGSRMEYDFRYTINGSLKEWRKGRAELGDAGKPGTVTYRRPQQDPVELPAGMIFPLARVAAILNRQATGEDRWTQLEFNAGILIKTSYSVTKRGVAARSEPEGDADLVSERGWQVRAENFDWHSDVAIEVTEHIVHGNGVSSSSLSLMNNSLNQLYTQEDLVRIKRLPVPQC